MNRDPSSPEAVAASASMGSGAPNMPIAPAAAPPPAQHRRLVVANSQTIDFEKLYFALLVERGRVGNTRWTAIGFFGAIAGLILKPATDPTTPALIRPLLTMIAWMVLETGYSLWIRLDAQTRVTRQYLEILEGRLPRAERKKHTFLEARHLWGCYPVGFIHFVEGRIVGEKVKGRLLGSRRGVSPAPEAGVQTGINLMGVLFKWLRVLLLVLIIIQLADLWRPYVTKLLLALQWQLGH